MFINWSYHNKSVPRSVSESRLMTKHKESKKTGALPSVKLIFSECKLMKYIEIARDISVSGGTSKGMKWVQLYTLLRSLDISFQIN